MVSFVDPPRHPTTTAPSRSGGVGALQLSKQTVKRSAVEAIVHYEAASLILARIMR